MVICKLCGMMHGNCNAIAHGIYTDQDTPASPWDGRCIMLILCWNYKLKMVPSVCI